MANYTINNLPNTVTELNSADTLAVWDSANSKTAKINGSNLSNSILSKLVVVDTVADGDMHPVTSNAVYGTLPKVYTVGGLIINATSDTTEGYGVATITLQNGIARIDFEAKITTAGTSNFFDWGLNRDLLKDNMPSLIPTIRPFSGGTAIYFNSSGVAMVDTDVGGSMGLAGSFIVKNQFWVPSRKYLKEGISVGGWSSNQFGTDTIIVGTCFGTY